MSAEQVVDRADLDPVVDSGPVVEPIEGVDVTVPDQDGEIIALGALGPGHLDEAFAGGADWDQFGPFGLDRVFEFEGQASASLPYELGRLLVVMMLILGPLLPQDMPAHPAAASPDLRRDPAEVETAIYDLVDECG